MKRADNQLLKIGEVAQLMGVRAQTIRNYEQQGLLTPVGRSKAGQHRLYGAYEVAKLRFIKRANLAGITHAEVKELLPLIAKGERGEDLPRLKEVLEEKLREIEWKLQEISGLRDSLLYHRGRLDKKEGES